MRMNRQTVVNRLRHNAQPLRARRPYVGQVLNHRHRNARTVWARHHVRWTRAMWSRVLFNDEYRFNLSAADGKVLVFRRKVKSFAQHCLLERGRFGGCSVMVLGGITGGRKTDLVIINHHLFSSTLR